MPGQIVARLTSVARGRRAVAAAGVTAIALAAGGVALWSAEGDLRDAEVVLRAGGGVTVVTPDGVSRSAVDGESLPRGAVVTTGPGVTATLDVRERLVRLAPETSVVVPDGSSTALRRGSILVDRRRGPEVTVRAGAVVVDEIDDGAVRVDRGFSVRVSVLSGGARATTIDRQLEIPRLHQAAVAGRALPDRPTPLRLSGDDWERLVIPAVVSADAELARLARGIDGDARLSDEAQVRLLPAVYLGALRELPPAAGRSEALLPVAIGLAVGEDRVGAARELRAEGGSWGVVASLVGARTATVSARLAELLAGPGESGPSDGPIAGPPGSVGFPSGSRPGPTPTRTGPANPSPSRTAGPSPTPSPSSSDVVGTVRELLPSGTPTPRPVVPSASPRRLLTGSSPEPGSGAGEPGGLTGILNALLG